MQYFLSGERKKPTTYLARLLFIFDGEIKSYTDKQKLKEFNTTK